MLTIITHYPCSYEWFRTFVALIFFYAVAISIAYLSYRASHAPLATTLRVPILQISYEIRGSESVRVEVEWVIVYGRNISAKCTTEVKMRPQQVTSKRVFRNSIIWQK